MGLVSAGPIQTFHHRKWRYCSRAAALGKLPDRFLDLNKQGYCWRLERNIWQPIKTAGWVVITMKDSHLKNISWTRKVIIKVGNPLLADSDELVILDTRNGIDIRTISVCLGMEQLVKYWKKVITDHTRDVPDPIKINNLPLFNCSQLKTKGKANGPDNYHYSRMMSLYYLICILLHSKARLTIDFFLQPREWITVSPVHCLMLGH